MVAYEMLRYVTAFVSMHRNAEPWKVFLKKQRVDSNFKHISNDALREMARDPFSISLDILATLESHMFLDTLDLIADAILPNAAPTILEAGAHIGEDAFSYMDKWPQGHIVAIEPHPDNFYRMASVVKRASDAYDSRAYVARWGALCPQGNMKIGLYVRLNPAFVGHDAQSSWRNYFDSDSS